jgi:Viral BACON domain
MKRIRTDSTAVHGPLARLARRATSRDLSSRLLRASIVSAFAPAAPAALAALAALAPLACSSPPQGSSASEGVGEVSAAITSVPASVSCIDIQVASGARVVDQQFDVKPGQSAFLTLQGLPLGSVVFNGFAYSTACAAVSTASAADYATDPVAATLAPDVVSNIELAFHPAGAANIGIDFDDAGTVPVPSIVITPPSLAYSLLYCGAAGQPQSFMVQNVTATAVTVAATSAGNLLSLSPATATIPAGASASFVATETPITAPHPIGPVEAAITLTTSVPFDAPHVIEAQMFVASALFQFGPITVTGTTGSTTLTNSGNASASFSFIKSPATSPLTLDPSSGTLAPGQSMTIALSEPFLFVPSATTVQLSSPNEVCEALPSFRFTPN